VGDPATEPIFELFKVEWRMPHIALNKINKLSMLRALESGRHLSMSFHSWELSISYYRTKHSYYNEVFLIIKTATQLEKSRYVIFGLQTDKKNIMTACKTYFDTCKLTCQCQTLSTLFYFIHTMI